MSLRKRIMLLVTIGLVVATVPLSVMGLGMVRVATDRVLEERLAMARATAAHIDERLTASQRQLEHLATQIAPLWGKGDRHGAAVVLTTVAPQLTFFSGGIFTMDPAGTLLSAEPAVLPVDTGTLTAQASVRRTLTVGWPQVSTIISGADGAQLVIFTVPVLRPDETIAGVVGGAINLTHPTLQVMIGHLPVGESGHAAIVDAQGIVLASTDPSELFTRGEHPRFLGQLIKERRALVGLAAEEHDPAGRPERHVMAFAPLGPVPWGVAIGQEEHETFGPIRRLRDRIILFDLAVLLAALLFAWLDTGAVVDPLRLLKEGAERIAGGDLARQVAVRRGDEIGGLARSFEAMRVQLLRSLEEIQRRARAWQVLYELGTEVLSLRDRDAVLQSVADRVVALLRGDVAILCLHDEAGRTARVSAVAGARAAVLQEVFPLNGGGAPVRCLDCGAIDARYLRSRLTAPLQVGGRTVGAICVGRQAAQMFSPEEREALDGLANLAAIAVENARLQERVQSVAVLEERERIAREMHDGAGQVLGYVNTKAQAVQALLEAGRMGEAQAHLAELEQAARAVYADLREAILGLRTETGPARRLIPVLQEYAQRFSELSGVVTTCVAEGDPDHYAFGPSTELHLLRIIQEALTNVRKHALARRARVRFAERSGVVTITVSDDGQGFDPGRLPAGGWPRFGLQTMRERAEAIGGTFVVRSGDGSGTEVEVRVPLAGGRLADARAAGG